MLSGPVSLLICDYCVILAPVQAPCLQSVIVRYVHTWHYIIKWLMWVWHNVAYTLLFGFVKPKLWCKATPEPDCSRCMCIAGGRW